MTIRRATTTAGDRCIKEAIHWYAILEAWEEWMADVRNRGEFEEIVQMCQLLRGLRPPPLPSIAELEADDS